MSVDSPVNPQQSISPSSTRTKSPLKLLIVLAIIAVLAIVGFIVFHYISGFEQTDDAQIDAHMNPVSSRINGTITKVLVSENQRVKAGQVLIELDPRDYQVQVEQSKAGLIQASGQLQAEAPNLSITSANTATEISTTQSDIAGAQAMVAAAQRDYQAALANQAVAKANSVKSSSDLKRYTMLINKDEVSREQYDAVVASAQAQSSNLAAASASAQAALKIIQQRQAALNQAVSRNRQAHQIAPQQIAVNQANIQARQGLVKIQQANLHQAQLNLSYTQIVAPVSGIVGKRSVEIGQQVQAGQPLMSITQVDDLWVTANFKETQLRRMHPGQRATLKVDAFNKEYEGYVESLPGASGARYSMLPPENATGNYVKVVQRLPVRIRFKADKQALENLRPGMSVEPKVWMDSH